MPVETKEPTSDYLNKALSNMLYEVASRPSVFDGLIDYKPLSRWERWKLWVKWHVPHVHLGPCRHDDEWG